MYVIKFEDGTFHAGDNKCVELEKAKVYKTEKGAKSMITKAFKAYEYAKAQSEESDSILGIDWIKANKEILKWYEDVNERMLQAEICKVKITIA